MLGANIDGWGNRQTPDHYYSLSTSGTLNGTSVTLTVENGELVATVGTKKKKGNDLQNLVLTGSDSRTFTISMAYPRDPVQELPTRYTLNDSAGPVCSDYAVFLTDEFTLGRAHVAATGRLSVGCEDGVAVKCVRWGYIPDASPGSDRWDLHQACTRMANADYCGTGDPGTNDGTYIAMFDNAHVRAQVPTAPPGLRPWKLKANVWPPPRGEYFLEAKWGPKGASCLSRARWYSQDDNGPCPIQLPDPRKQSSGGEFCDDMTDAELTSGKQVLLSVSMFNDLRMFTWQNADGDLIATVRGYPSDADPTYPNNDQMMRPYGPTGGTMLRAMTDEWNNDTSHILDQLNMFCVPGTDRCTLAPAGTTGMTDKGFEGYVFVSSSDSNDTLLPLQTYDGTLPNGNADDVAVPESTEPTGYSPGAILGYIFP
jgi:hypothetical protein